MLDKAKVVNSYDPSGRRVFRVRSDNTLDFLDGDIDARYRLIRDTMLYEVCKIEGGQ